jgi:hypothetical protein
MVLFLTTCPAAAQMNVGAVPLRDHFSDLSGENRSNRPAVERGSKPTVANDRLFFALPNFLTVESTQRLQPLTVGQNSSL